MTDAISLLSRDDPQPVEERNPDASPEPEPEDDADVHHTPEELQDDLRGADDTDAD